MPQVIRIKRNVTTALAPTTLDPGELAYTKNGHKLFIGDDTNTVNNLVSVDRQLEIHANSPAQTIDALAGAKTFPLAKLKVPGGNVGDLLSMSAVDGTLAYTPALTASQQFVGSFKGSTGVVTFTTASGGTGPGLPAAAVGNNGWYVIADDAGATPPAGSGATGPFNIGDWIISNGTAWTHLAFGGTATVMAADVGVVAPVAGGNDVQEVLESLETKDTAQDALIAANTAAIALLPTTAYVDAENDAQDAAQLTKDTAQDAAIAANTAALANYLPLVGGTVTGPIILPVAAPTTDPMAANKKYVDDSIAAIPGASPPLVTAPELVGDGALGSEITFTGITLHANVAAEMSGNGLSTSPLNLTLVDGGVYA
jgi:hypothetical protein